MRLRRTLTLTLAILIASAGLTAADAAIAPLPAGAAATGAGVSGITPYGGFLGNYIAPDGSRVYCIDSSRDWPGGATSGGTLVGSLTTTWGAPLSSTVLQKLNYALQRYGQTADPVQAAGLSAYIYAYTSTYARYNGAGYAAGAHYIDGNRVVGGAYYGIWNDVEANYATVGRGTATVSIEMANAYDGFVRVTTNPANARGTLTLEGAVVASTGASNASVGNGSLVAIRGVPQDAELSYSIAARASFTASSGAAPNVTVYTTGSQQRTIRNGNPGSVSFSAADSVKDIPLLFEPVVQTSVASRFVDDGAPFVDGLVASVAEGSGPWRTLEDGSGVPVVATGTLYGPFTSQPDVAATPPVGAPVVGTESLTLTGPGDYLSAGTLTAPRTGFYSWVWRIEAAQQPPETIPHLPEGYAFADEFGLVAETHVVPMRLVAESQVTAPEIGLGGTVGDVLSVAIAEGSWLERDGAPIRAVFEGTAYFVAGDQAPVASADVPANATVIGTATITATGPGEYPASSEVTAPSATAGWITWVWSLAAGEHAAYFEPWTDWFGLPAETTRVSPPTVTTLAVPAVAIGDPVHDTAIVGGIVPAPHALLVFDAYLQVSGEPPTCDASTLAWSSSDQPIQITEVGNYLSPETRFEEYGTYFWVESLFSHDGQLIHRGVCGLPDETTLVAPGDVVTLATADVTLGKPAHDTARVTGLVPQGAILVFEAHRQDSPDGPLCDETTLVFTSEAVDVTGPGDYRSSSTTFDEPGTYFWVETLLDRNGEPLQRGECGAEGETTRVGNLLAATGVSVIPVIVLGLALAMLGLAMGISSRRRRWHLRD